MSFERVLLINPPYRVEWGGVSPHIGQAYLAQTLLQNEIEYDVLEMNLGYKLKHLMQKIEDFRPDVIGMSLLSVQYRRAYELLSEIKKTNRNVKIVVGGPHVTIMREKVLQDCPAIDYGVTFEGECTLTELCQGSHPDDKIKGLIYRDGDAILYSGDREPVINLDEIPWPRYEKFELNRYIDERTIYSSRGCPHQCTFCPNRIISPYYRARSAGDVVDEIEYWYSRGHRQFNIDDDNFNLIRERVFAICDEIEQRGLKQLYLRCSNGIRADRVDMEILTRMREVGFGHLAFGVDGGNNKILEIVKKGETIESIERAVRDSCSLGYEVKLLFVVGTPYETREDIEDKVRLCKRYPIQEVHFYNTIPYPGTELYDWVLENDYFLRKPEDYLNDPSCTDVSTVPVFETPELPRKARMEVMNYLHKVRRQVHRRAVRRIFKRHSTLGMLVSYVSVNSVGEKLFYQNRLFRRIVDGLRYKLALGK
jgi:radical SAM superfamily enzyme YgiQ (UPF0313 family)